MEFTTIRSSKLRNGEHAQFFTEVDELIDKETPALLQIEQQSALFKTALGNEFEALGLIRKSVITDELEVVDQPRDYTYRGTVGTAKAALNHYNAEVRKAAAKVMVVFDSFGNVAAMPYNEETIAIRKLRAELMGSCSAEVTLLGLEPWLNELEAQNNAFDTLMKERYSEEAGRTALRMKTIRIEVEAAYKKILKRIDALIEINGDENYKEFIAQLNIRVANYNNTVARREGNKGDGDEPKTE